MGGAEKEEMFSFSKGELISVYVCAFNIYLLI